VRNARQSKNTVFSGIFPHLLTAQITGFFAVYKDSVHNSVHRQTLPLLSDLTEYTIDNDRDPRRQLIAMPIGRRTPGLFGRTLSAGHRERRSATTMVIVTNPALRVSKRIDDVGEGLHVPLACSHTVTSLDP
jgi:hypothetical protein